MRFREAPATYAIAALTILVSAAVLLFVAPDFAVPAGGFIPARVTGVLAGDPRFPIPAWLTPLSATLLHGGWVHLLFNMVMLIYCGRQTERALAAGSIVTLYLIGAYAAAAGQWAENPGAMEPMIGASGAISAIVAAYALLYGRNRARRIGPVPAGLLHALWLGAAWIAINLMMEFVTVTGSPIAVGAHIGGFVVGLVLTRPLLRWRYRNA